MKTKAVQLLNAIHDVIYRHMKADFIPLQWRHNWRDGVPNHQPRDCSLHLLSRRRSKKTSKLYVAGLWAGNSPVTGEFPAQMDQ